MSSDILKLDARSHVRLRPGMYIGGTDQRALHHMIYEVLQECIYDVFAGVCNYVEVILLPQNLVLIRDHSPGLPLQIDESAKSAAEIIITQIGSYRRVRPSQRGYYAPSGLFGVGIACVNMLSNAFTVEIRRDGFLWRIACRTGLAQGGLQRVRPLYAGEPTGNTFIFQPDFTILERHEFDFATLALRCAELAYQCKGLRSILRDERCEPALAVNYYAPDGLQSQFRELAGDAPLVHDLIYIREDVEVVEQRSSNPIPLGVEIAFAFTDGDASHLLSYVNTVQTILGGSHVSALKATLLAVINDFDGYNHSYDFTWEEISQGLVAIVSVRHPTPNYASPTRAQLHSPEVYGVIAERVYRAANQWKLIHAVQERLMLSRNIRLSDES